MTTYIFLFPVKWFHDHPDLRAQAIRGEVEIPLSDKVEPPAFAK
jgi:hypothetical protein